MASPKLLIGGLVGVGSVSTAAVVAHQQGFFPSFNNQTQSSDSAPNADTAEGQGSTDPNPADRASEQQTRDTTPSTTPSKPKQEEVNTWLKANQGNDTWTIKIKKSGKEQEEDFKHESITETDLEGLKGYLSADERESLLKDLFSALESKTLTFEKTDDNWKLVLTKEDIKKWANETSGNKATLKFSEGNETKDLDGVQEGDLNKLLKNLFDGKSAFTGITVATTDTPKNILFEKVENDWKHSKTEIKSWLSTNTADKLKIQIKTTGDTVLDNEKEENLLRLFSYLKTEENKNTLLKLIKDPTPITLTFKKESNSWDVVHSETTINNWVSNVSSTKVTLQLKENKPSTDEEWKKLFVAIKLKETELFSSTEPSRTVIFEKLSDGWKHIKEAIDGLISTNSWNKSIIKICSGSSPKGLDDISDSDLVGFYSHLDNNKTSYTDLKTEGGSSTDVTFKKEDSGWAKKACA